MLNVLKRSVNVDTGDTPCLLHAPSSAVTELAPCNIQGDERRLVQCRANEISSSSTKGVPSGRQMQKVGSRRVEGREDEA